MLEIKGNEKDHNILNELVRIFITQIISANIKSDFKKGKDENPNQTLDYRIQKQYIVL